MKTSEALRLVTKLSEIDGEAATGETRAMARALRDAVVARAEGRGFSAAFDGVLSRLLADLEVAPVATEAQKR